MSKININGLDVELLGSLKLNGHSYIFGLVNNDLNFYEMTRNEFGINYVLPKKDFTLEGNAGGSIRELNGRIFMQNFANDLKRDIKLGKLRSLADISKEIDNMQSVFNELGADELKSLFKGNVSNLDDEVIMNNASNLFNKLNTKRKNIGKDDFDFVDGGQDVTFSVKKEEFLPKQELPKQSSFSITNAASDDITPTVIVGSLHDLTKQEVAKEMRSETPSTEIMGFKDSEVSNEVLEETLERKSDEMTNLQKAYIKEVLASREEQEEVKEEPKEEVKEPEIDSDPTLLLPKVEVETKEEKDELEDTVTSLEDYKRYQESKKKEAELEEQEEKGKVLTLTKVSRKAAYVDTVILCLLVQLGIFGLLIFVLLLIK